MAMIAVPLHRPPSLIPGAFEPSVRPFRNTHAAGLAPAVPLQIARPDVETGSAPYVVAAPYAPTTLLGWFAAVLGDVVLGAVVVLGLVLTPILAVSAIVAAGSFILKTLGR